MSEVGENVDVDVSPRELEWKLDESEFDDVIRLMQEKPKILVQNIREYGFSGKESLVVTLVERFKRNTEPDDDDDAYYNDFDDFESDDDSEDDSEDDSNSEDDVESDDITEFPTVYFPPSWSTTEWKIQDHEKKKEDHHPTTEKIVQAIKIALEIWPEAIHDINKEGRTLLHIAYEYGAPDEIVALLQQESPKMMETKDNFGHSPHDCASARKLRLAVLKRQWSQFNSLLDHNPDIAMVRFRSFVYRSENGRSCGHAADTILHLVIRRKFDLRQRIPYAIFQSLLSKCPPLVTVHNSDSGCPLHVAIENRADEETILELLRLNPESTKEVGYNDYVLPIIMALKREDRSVCVLKPVAKASRNIKLEDPEAVELLTLAVHRDAFVLEAVLAILTAAPRTATKLNKGGDYPLFSLMERCGDFDVFQPILDLCPDILSLRDLNGKSLLHVAYENHGQQETIDRIKEMRNELLSERDLYGRLPIDMTSSKSEEIFVPMNSCLLLSDTKGFVLHEEGIRNDDGQVALCQKNILMRDPSPEQKGDRILWNKTFGVYFNDQLRARDVIFKTLLEEFSKLVQISDTKVIQRAAILQALACQHLSQGEKTIVDLSSLTQEGYWYQQEVLKLVMRIYNEDLFASDNSEESAAIFSDGSNCADAIGHVHNYLKEEAMDLAMSARIGCFMDLLRWLVDEIAPEGSYDFAGPSRKPLQSLFNKFYIRRGQTKVKILGDTTRATLAINDVETLQRVKQRIEEHFPSIVPENFQPPDTLGTIGFLEYIHRQPKVPGTNIIPYRFKPNGSQTKEHADNPLWFNFNFFDGIPEYHRSGNSEIFVAFELQIGLKEEIEKHRQSHVAYERDRILDGQPCLKNYVEFSEKSMSSTSTCTVEDIAIINNVLEGNIATEILKKGKDIVFHYDAKDAPSTPDQEEESPKRLCLNNKQFNMMSTKALAGPFSLDPKKRYNIHSLTAKFDKGLRGSVGLYAHLGPYRVEVALGTKPVFLSPSPELAEQNRRFRVRNIVNPGNNYAYFERVCMIPPESTAIDLTVTGSGICKKMELVLHEFVAEAEDSWPVRTKIE